MRPIVPLLSLGLALTVFGPERAEACGGCFVPPEESTQVTGHRMILSLSQTQTTLYDQIEYSGAPESFAWVLPIQGQVDVGLSSDTLFAFLGQNTQTYVAPPPQSCPPPPPDCYNDASEGGGFGGGAGGASGNGGVDILSQAVVGPYETVQLQASDPLALRSWLESHGYNLPADIEPTVDAYVNEGFAFLAMKLVPGQDVSAMRPVRITAPGAGLAMPLRMVAAGTGAYTPITLFVVAEGRYAPSNFPAYEIDRTKVGFDSVAWASNLDDLEAAGREEAGENAWLTKVAVHTNREWLTSPIEQVLDFNVTQSGYGDPLTGEGAWEEYQADADTLFGGMDPTSIWYTRLYANLPRQSLGQDLFLGATAQDELGTFIQATYWINGEPPCPTYEWCDGSGSGTGGGSASGTGGTGGVGVNPTQGGGSAACAMGRGESARWGLVALGAAALVLGGRRRRR